MYAIDSIMPGSGSLAQGRAFADASPALVTLTTLPYTQHEFLQWTLFLSHGLAPASVPACS